MNKTLLTLTVALASPVLAEPHVHFDLAPVVQNGQIVTDGLTHLSAENPWTGDEALPSRYYISPGQRVFEYEFGENTLFPRRSTDPGINRAGGTYELQDGSTTTIGGTGMPNGSILSFTVLDDLRYWNGSAFGAVASGVTLALTYGDTRTLGAGTGELAPLPIKQFSGSDTIHEHIVAELSVTAPAGVYLVEARFETDVTSIADSLPFWLVYGFAADEESHEAAVEWVETNLVPEPGVMSVLAIGAVAMLRRRRA